MERQDFKKEFEKIFPNTSQELINIIYDKYTNLLTLELKAQKITPALKKNQPHIYDGLLKNIQTKCFKKICQEQHIDTIHHHKKGDF